MHSIIEKRTDGARTGGEGRVKRKRGLFARTAVVLSAVLALGAPGVAAAPAASASQVADEAAQHALDQVGKPYQYGGNGPSAFDCSGLVKWSYSKAGRSLARTTYDQVRQGSAVSRADIRKGDLVFFYSGPSHVGIALGDGRMVHAPNSGGRVEVVDMANYYNSQLTHVRRVA